MKVEQLDLKDREEFGRIVNILLAENCIYQYAKIRQFEKKERNADYVFIHDHWDCFEEYPAMRDGCCAGSVHLIWG